MTRPIYDSKKIMLRKTKKFGRGVYAKQKIKKGEVVAVFDGPFYDDEFDDWTKDLLNHTIQCGKALWRDSKGLARYLNHSCEPNCGIKGRFKVVTMRAIKPGEQLTWDYEMTEKSDWWKLKCKCGAPSCRKVIGNYRNLPLKLRKKYKGFISTWL
jgi:uncharacterized protein